MRKEKIVIKIPKIEMPKPRIPIWKMKSEKTHTVQKTDPKTQRIKGKEEIRKLMKSMKSKDPKADY